MLITTATRGQKVWTVIFLTDSYRWTLQYIYAEGKLQDWSTPNVLVKSRCTPAVEGYKRKYMKGCVFFIYQRTSYSWRMWRLAEGVIGLATATLPTHLRHILHFNRRHKMNFKKSRVKCLLTKHTVIGVSGTPTGTPGSIQVRINHFCNEAFTPLVPVMTRSYARTRAWPQTAAVAGLVQPTQRRPFLSAI